jgi:hypothetical protein
MSTINKTGVASKLRTIATGSGTVAEQLMEQHMVICGVVGETMP